MQLRPVLLIPAVFASLGLTITALAERAMSFIPNKVQQIKT